MNNTPAKDTAELRLIVVQADWALRYLDERSRIEGVLLGSALNIQHIGSTAIPGITAKAILDIAVAIRDFESGHALVQNLASLDYTYHGENGMPRRHYFDRDDMVHLHMFERDSLDWKRHLRFRDRLLASPELATRYSRVKLDAARDSRGCRENYQTLKASFIGAVQSL